MNNVKETENKVVDAEIVEEEVVEESKFKTFAKKVGNGIKRNKGKVITGVVIATIAALVCYGKSKSNDENLELGEFSDDELAEVDLDDVTETDL